MKISWFGPSRFPRAGGIFLVCLFALAQPSGAQTAAPSPSSRAGRSLRLAPAIEAAHKIAGEVQARGIPGISFAVAVDRQIVWSEGLGYADLEQRVPAWPTTKFRIGSISKPLTAAALLKLVEAGKLDVDQPIQKYVPSFPVKGAPITARLLAGHLAGIRHYQGEEFYIQKHYAHVVDGLAIFKDDPLVAPPGTKFNYSTHGYDLLSAAIESACGVDFLSCMNELVIDPLGLRSTVPDQPAEIVPERSRFYARIKDGPLENAAYVDNSYKWAGGGFLSSAEDLVRFGSALLAPGYLKPGSLELLFTSQKSADGKETGYGMGWSIGKSNSGQRLYSHSGGSVGGSSQLILYPDTHVVAALICNLGDAGWKREDLERIAEAFVIKK